MMAIEQLNIATIFMQTMGNTFLRIKMLIRVSLCLLLITINFKIHAAVKNSAGGFIDINVNPYISDVDNDTQFFNAAFKAINLSWSINFYVKQFDSVPENIWQMEHVFRMTFPTIDNLLYIGGFFDHTFNENVSVNVPKNPIVGEIGDLGEILIAWSIC